MKPPRRPQRRTRSPRPSTGRGGTRAWAKLSKDTARQQPLCWLRLPGCTLRSTGADHYYPVKTHPHLEYVPSNLRGACHHCNTARRDTPVALLPKLRATMLASGKYTQRPTNRPALGFFE